MTDTAESLDPLRLPLQGERLIEASAGTGKTFTIAALYLRLLLGLGGNAAFPRPLSVEGRSVRLHHSRVLPAHAEPECVRIRHAV